MPGKIYIQDNPFEEILRSAYETLRVECMGNLFGRQEKGQSWVVEQVHPVQIADRSPTIVSTYDSFRGEWSFFDNHIGFFHSHVPASESLGVIRLKLQPRANFSAEDVADLKRMPRKVELVTAIKRVKSRREVNHNPRLISGYIEGQNKIYRFDMAACYYDSIVHRAELAISDRMRRLIA